MLFLGHGSQDISKFAPLDMVLVLSIRNFVYVLPDPVARHASDTGLGGRSRQLLLYQQRHAEHE